MIVPLIYGINKSLPYLELSRFLEGSWDLMLGSFSHLLREQTLHQCRSLGAKFWLELETNVCVWGVTIGVLSCFFQSKFIKYSNYRTRLNKPLKFIF